MSEYWVSKKRYFCKYCDIYITDDAPSRQQHENGLRHQGNKDRFVRGLYKAGEKRKKDLEEEKREMARIEQAAQAAFSQDVGAGHAKPITAHTPTPSVASSSRKPATRAGGVFADYSTAESLGYTDPDLERALAEAERRQQQGFVGEWQIVENTTPPMSAHLGEQPAEGIETGAEPAEGSNKRPAEEPLDEEDEHRWKLRKKTVSVGLGEIYDPGIIAIKVKPKKEEPKDDSGVLRGKGTLGDDAIGIKAGTGETGPKASAMPRWTSVKWKKTGVAEADGDAGVPSTSEDNAVPDSDNTPDSETVDANGETKEEPNEGALEPLVKVESVTAASTALGNNLFKKRKVPIAAGAGRRGRTF